MALAIEAFSPVMGTFTCGREFAAWLGLVPKQMSSGGKERLGRVSNAGQSDIRRLLIFGAMSRLNWMDAKGICEGRGLIGCAAALPCKTWPIARPSLRWTRLHHQRLGSNI